MPSDTSVGQGVTQIYHYRDGVRYELVQLKEVAKHHKFSESYLRYLADVGEIIATKIAHTWFVDKRLIKK